MGGSLLIAGRAVDLAREIEVLRRREPKRPVERAGIAVVVLDRVARLEDACLLEPGNAPHHGRLNVLGQRGRDAVGIDGRIVQTLRFQEDLVRVPIGKAYDLVLDRRAIAWALPLDHAAIHGGTLQVHADQLVRLARRSCHAACDLRAPGPVGEEREVARILVRFLPLQPVPRDRAAVEPGRRAGLQTSQPYAAPREGVAKRVRALLAPASGRSPYVTDMDEAAEERARGQHHRTGCDRPVPRTDDARHAIAFECQVGDLVLQDGKVRLLREQRLDRRPIERAIGLSARTAHGRTLATVE